VPKEIDPTAGIGGVPAPNIQRKARSAARKAKTRFADGGARKTTVGRKGRGAELATRAIPHRPCGLM
jgi:hypothetical protein